MADVRQHIAEALRKAADYPIVTEWICCNPVKPDHEMCRAGEVAREMLRAVLADDPDRLFLPSGVVEAVMRVHDTATEQLRARAERAEALLRALVGPEDSPCMYDHHGYCQEHGLHANPCPVARARKLLAQLDQEAG